MASFHGKLRTSAHLKESHSIATYLSSDIRNELLVKKFYQVFSLKLKMLLCFAIIADETTDKSIKS